MGTLTDLLHVELEAVSSEGEPLESASRVGLRTSVVELAVAVAADLASVLDPRAAGWTVAVLPFDNHAENDFDPLVRGLPDMLMTTLGEAAELTVIERVQIDKALRNFNLEMSGPIDWKSSTGTCGTRAGMDRCRNNRAVLCPSWSLAR